MAAVDVGAAAAVVGPDHTHNTRDAAAAIAGAPAGPADEAEEVEEYEEFEEEVEDDDGDGSSENAPQRLGPRAGVKLPDIDPVMIQVQGKPHGLRNIGNTCYLNSGVQVLANCDAFAMMLVEQAGEWVTSRMKGGLTDTRRHALLKSWRWLLRTLQQAPAAGGANVIDPTFFVRDVMAANSQFVGFSQQDSNDLVRTLIGSLDDELRTPFHIPKVLASIHGLPLPRDPQARRHHQLLSFLDATCRRNIDIDQRAHDRQQLAKGKKLTFTSHDSGAYYPRKYRSLVSELFELQYASTLTCRVCGEETTRIAPETGLELEIVFPWSRRADTGPLRPEDARVATTTGSWLHAISRAPLHLTRMVVASTLSYVRDVIYRTATAAWTMMSSPPDEPPLPLRESLKEHFGRERIDSTFDCPRCEERMPCVKQMSIAALPEFLVVTFKRFEQKSAYWYSKINGHIPFPIDVNADGSAGRVPSAPQFSDDEGDGSPPSLTAPPVLDLRDHCLEAGGLPRPANTEYDLIGLVAHRGSYHGGHYVSFVFKQGRWMLCNDERLALVAAGQVAREHAYMLVYRRRPPAGELACPLVSTSRGHLARLLEAQNSSDRLLEALRQRLPPEAIAFIPRQWLVKHAYTVDPGMILSQVQYPFGDDETPTRSAREFYCPIPRTDWEVYAAKYGGGPCVTLADYIAQLRKEGR